MSTRPMPVHGADVSHFQGTLDLAAAKRAGLKFLYSKATEGTSYVDPSYATRRAAARKAGIPFGGYHFARPTKTNAVAEAKHFLAIVKPAEGDLIPALDLEVDGGLAPDLLKNWAKIFSNTVERTIGVKPIIYSPWNLGLPNIKWVPRYNSTNTPPVVPWDIWQFSNGEYGVPSSAPGLGHVDLNTLRDGFKFDSLIYKGAKPQPKTVRRTFGHLSGHVYDTVEHRKADFDKLFARGYDIVTWTEAADIESQVSDLADKHGYIVNQKGRGDGGAAIKRSLIKPGSLKRDFIHVIDSAPASGDPIPHGSVDITWVEYDDVDLGRHVSVGGGVHALTKGRTPNQLPDSAPVDHYAENTKLVHACGDWAVEQGKGSAIAFLAADSNMNDAKVDVFRGAPLTTCWDELDIHPNTGHGNIDVIASYDADKSVKWVRARAFTDAEAPFYSDHFLIEAVAEILVKS